MSDESFETHAKYSIKYGHVFIARVEWHGICEPSKQVFLKKKPSSSSVLVGSAGSRIDQVFILDGFLFYPNRSSHSIDRVPG